MQRTTAHSIHVRAGLDCTFLGVSSLVFLSALFATSSNAAVAEVVFRVGQNATIDWFELNAPAVRGTLQVTNAPYSASTSLNAAAVDVSRNRLIFDTAGANPQCYSINLAGLQLVQNAATSVSLAALGTWDTGSVAAAGYSKNAGGVYYHTSGSDTLRQLNFDGNGLISGFTTIGNLNGASTPNTIAGGDLDFSASGSLWMSGTDENSTSHVWNFNPATLVTLTTLNPGTLYEGITFNAAGDTLYAYNHATHSYGILNQGTGAFQTVLSTDSTEFGVTGDLATGTLVVVVPEPGSVCLLGVAAIALVTNRRQRRKGAAR